MILRIFFLMLFGTFLFVLSTNFGHAQEKQRYIYSVKYVCGLNSNGLNSTSSTVAAGAYKTEINIQRATNAFSGRISVTPTDARPIFSEVPVRSGRSFQTNLTGSEVVKVLCQYISDLMGEPATSKFRVGFLQIFSTEPLSVVAVYTAKHCKTTVGSRFLGNAICEGDIALDVVRYDPILIEAMGKGGEGPG